jgi:uncharacterized iron-regulated membrane protein
MVVVLAMTRANSYAGLVAAILLSLAATWGLRTLVDRNIDRLRDDAIREGRVRPVVAKVTRMRLRSDLAGPKRRSGRRGAT